MRLIKFFFFLTRRRVLKPYPVKMFWRFLFQLQAIIEKWVRSLLRSFCSRAGILGLVPIFETHISHTHTQLLLGLQIFFYWNSTTQNGRKFILEKMLSYVYFHKRYPLSKKPRFSTCSPLRSTTSNYTSLYGLL